MTAMLEDLSRNWGWIALRGLVAVLFGVFALIWPGLTLAALVIAWGVFALLDGALALIAAFAVHDEGRPFWALVAVGLLGLAAGVLTFLWPAITAIVLLLLIASWAIAMGAFQIVAAIRLRREIEHEWLLVLSGVLSVLFGVVMVVQPAAGALALIWAIGSYWIFFGVLLLALAFRIKGFTDRLLTGRREPAPAR